MRHKPVGRMWLWVGLSAWISWIGVGLGGCTGPMADVAVFKPMRAMLQMKEPVRIGITRLHLNPLERAPWASLGEALEKAVARPVQVGMYRPFQIRELLEGGYLDFAILSATDYVEVGGADNCVVLARPVNTLGRDRHAALIVARKDSNLESLADLKGRRFAFGPQRNALVHWAAADALLNAGLRPADVALEMLPVPMTRRHHVDSYEVAKAVVYEVLPAGAVDELEYATWPEVGGSLVLGTVSKDQLRIVTRTADLPEGPIVASTKTDPALVAKVKQYLLSGDIDAAALQKIRWTRFEPADASAYGPVAEMVQKLYRAGWLAPELPGQAPASGPAVATSQPAG